MTHACESCGGYCMHARDCPVMAYLDAAVTIIQPALEAACREAYEAGRTVESVTLPEGIWPEVSVMQNTITRETVPVVRVPLLAVTAQAVQGGGGS